MSHIYDILVFITLHQNGLICKEIASKNIAPERKNHLHQELQGERFGCSKEGFGMSQSVQQTPGMSFGQRPGVMYGSKEATTLQDNLQVQNETRQKVQGLDGRGPGVN